MTKVAATPIYGKNLEKLIFFSRTGSSMILKVGMQHRGLKLYKVCINGDAGLTLVKFGNLGFSMGKSENSGFSETIAACDLKVGRCRQLVEFMKVCEY